MQIWRDSGFLAHFPPTVDRSSVCWGASSEVRSGLAKKQLLIRRTLCYSYNKLCSPTIQRRLCRSDMDRISFRECRTHVLRQCTAIGSTFDGRPRYEYRAPFGQALSWYDGAGSSTLQLRKLCPKSFKFIILALDLKPVGLKWTIMGLLFLFPTSVVLGEVSDVNLLRSKGLGTKRGCTPIAAFGHRSRIAYLNH